VPETRYRIRHWDGVMAIEANADASMSLLARPVQTDLTKTPWLCWRWRVEAPLVAADMKRQSGDDYAARVYVAFNLPDAALSWSDWLKLAVARGRYGDQVPDAAINYVWDNRYPVGTWMPNAYAGQTRMHVLQSGTGNAGHWQVERRNLLQDAQQAFGTQDVRLTMVAVASDTDNTGEHAHAGFADLHFADADSACDFPAEPSSASP
jgi:hypothetical protein